MSPQDDSIHNPTALVAAGRPPTGWDHLPRREKDRRDRQRRMPPLNLEDTVDEADGAVPEPGDALRDDESGLGVQLRP